LESTARAVDGISGPSLEGFVFVVVFVVVHRARSFVLAGPAGEAVSRAEGRFALVRRDGSVVVSGSDVAAGWRPLGLGFGRGVHAAFSGMRLVAFRR